MKPMVSCYCPTYGRVHVLEEAIESFLRQDYDGPKELVVLNDCRQQYLTFDHPQVRVFNCDRVRPIGAKFDLCIRMCKGTVLACWDDDDIFLPHRLTYSVEHMRDGVFQTGDGFFEVSDTDIQPSSNTYHSTLVMEKEAYLRAGGYGNTDFGDLDIQFLDRLREATGFEPQPTQVADRSYIYRWATVNSYHTSAFGLVDVSDKIEHVVSSKIAAGEAPRGLIQLRPRWKYNYMEFLPK